MPRWAERRALLLAALLLAAPACVRVTPAPTAPAGRAEPAVKVGLLVDTTSVVVSSSAGLTLRDAATGRALGSVPAATAVTFHAPPGGGLSYQVAGGPALAAPALVLAGAGGEATVEIGGKAYRGAALLRAARPGRVTAINQVDMEDYLLGVVPREIGTVGDTLIEAAKAQAVAARTYAVKYLGRRSTLGFDVYATVQDQVYGGVASEHAPVSRAVRATAGEILTYQGEPIEAYYHSTCAGQTAAIDEVWKERPVPYLVSVVDVDPATGQAYDVRSSRFRWTTRWTIDQFQQILTRTLADSLPAGVQSPGELRDLRVLERTPSGRVRALRITTANATFTVGGDRVRWILPTPQGPILNSSKFDIEVVRDAQGRATEVVATGGGWGHGIGMCQVGAMGRDRAGQDYRTILRAYYPGTEIRDLY